MRNREGLTWAEWFAVATYGKKASDISKVTIQEMRKEWDNCVKPSDWAQKLTTGAKG